MWIKSDHPSYKEKLVNLVNRLSAHRILFFAVLFMAFMGGTIFHKAIHDLDVMHMENTFFRMYLRRLGFPIERINIDLKFKDYQTLEYKRAITLSAQQKGLRPILFAEDDDYVKARIRKNNKSTKIRMRLKGDWADHISNRQWSFRIKTRRGKSVFDMKRFSLNAAHTRHYLYEWLYHQLLKSQGLIALRFRFVRLALNGQDLGVYALEEHFSKELIEYYGHREGPIIKFSEDIFWQQMWGRNLSGLNSYDQNEVFLQHASPIIPFQSNKIMNNPSQRTYYEAARSLLEGFRSGQIPASNVFDVNKMCRFVVASQIMGAWHALRWHNLRLYYNPITRLLEPIGFDGDSGTVLSDYILSHPVLSIEGQRHLGHTFYYYFFRDPKVYKTYREMVNTMTEPEYLDRFFQTIENEYHVSFNQSHFYDRLFRRNFYVLLKYRFYNNQKVLRQFVMTKVKQDVAIHPPEQKAASINEYKSEPQGWRLTLKRKTNQLLHHLISDKGIVIEKAKSLIKLLLGLGLLI